jgi:glycosyltransferase involved in cell wall biosynthesis
MLADITASVALCTCNGEKFLAQQLQSIRVQSRRVDEIIICDDCSDDTTAEIVLAFATQARICVKWFRNPVRLGVTKNFEKAISLCSGKFIVLCDQDDVWSTDKVETLLNLLENSSAAMAFSNAQVVRDDLSPAGYRLWDSIWFNANEQQRIKNDQALPVLLRHAIAAGSTLAFRAEYLPLILPIPDLPNSHDIWITLLLSCVGSIKPIDRDLIQYRLHAANQVGMRKFGLIDQIRMARHQIKTNTFGYLAQLHQAAHDRLVLQQSWPVRPNALKLLEEKIRHSQVRERMSQNPIARLRTIAGELLRGNYSKYSYGFKSVLQDLFLR